MVFVECFFIWFRTGHWTFIITPSTYGPAKNNDIDWQTEACLNYLLVIDGGESTGRNDHRPLHVRVMALRKSVW
jgi:hypothetical protein